jgi:restriction system protein
MSGTDFEQSMKELFERLGFKVEHCQYTKQGGDGGVDLVLVREDEILGLDRYVVQCKNYQLNRKIDSPVINQLKGAAPTKNAQRCIIVTTSSFTEPARKTARENGIPVQLIDGRDLSKLILPRVQELPSIQKLLNC